jgi:predicted ATP-grasp superfamily ATP-dependent carboligase
MAVFIAEHSEQLKPIFRFPEQRSTVVRRVANKYQLSQLCTELGVPSPKVIVPEDRADVLAFCNEAIFPVMAKVTDAAALSQANIRSTSIAATPTDLLVLWERVEQHVHGKLMFQEFIPDGEDWIFHGYCNKNSDAIAAYTGIKLRSAPPFAGATALGRTRWNETLAHSAQTLFHKIGYRGIMDMDWRFDRRDGLYKLLDFNPRVGAQFRMFVDGQGVDVVRAMHLDMTGRGTLSGQPPNGRGFMVENYDISSALGGYRRAGLTLRQWYTSLQGVQELGWFSRDDLLPTVALSTYLATDIGKRALRRGVRQFFGGSRRNVIKADRHSPGHDRHVIEKDAPRELARRPATGRPLPRLARHN